MSQISISTKLQVKTQQFLRNRLKKHLFAWLLSTMTLAIECKLITLSENVSFGVLPGEPENNPAKHGLMHPGEQVMVRPPVPARSVTFSESTIFVDWATSRLGFKRSLTFRSVVSGLKRTPAESKCKKVRGFLRKARDRMKKDHNA
ncbi:hypothetical protein B9Z19DRAFT_1129376 [Tuber borchii]|uniref:Uncharacterized protein n=1 Tax=Tuber borchii TaxID=42251 RepID=A0A2T6ZMK2_TUBBO|nr:hypothetical protein B9Z19DRAFT_1129376 [Tuber borchii]